MQASKISKTFRLGRYTKTRASHSVELYEEFLRIIVDGLSFSSPLATSTKKPKKMKLSHGVWKTKEKRVLHHFIAPC